VNKCGLDLECSNCVISVTCSIAALDTKEPALHIPQQPQERHCAVDHQAMSIDRRGRGNCPECGVPLH